MLRHPNQQIMQQAYARWAPVYDVLCGPIFLPGRRAAAARVLVAASSNSAPARAFRFDDYDDGRRDE